MDYTYLEHITLFVLNYLFVYENVRKIEVNNLREAFDILYLEYSDSDELPTNEEFISCLKDVLIKNSFVLGIDDNNIILKDDVNYTNFYIYCFNKNYNFDKLFLPEIVFDNELAKVLNIKSIEEKSDRYISIEDNILKKYESIDDFKDNSDIINEIKKFMIIRNIYFTYLNNLPIQKIEAYRDISAKEHHIELKYDKYPIDLKLFRNYIGDKSAHLDYILYELFQYTIFSNTYGISVARYCDEVEKIYRFQNSSFIHGNLNRYNDDTYINDEIDNTNDYYIFYMKYLKNLIDYLKDNDDELLRLVKNRLLYSLDNIDTLICDKNNLEKEFERIKDIEININYIEDIDNEVYFLIQEIFINEIDSNTIKKLLLIKTYYDFTKDKDIFKLVDNYKESDNYLYIISYINNYIIKEDNKVEKIMKRNK